MVGYSNVNVRSNTQLKKLKDAVKDNTGATLRINLRMSDGNYLPHELFITHDKTKSKAKKCF